MATLFLLFIVSNHNLNRPFLSPPALVGEAADESGDRAVVGLLYLRREDTAGKLTEFQVISDAFAALTLAGAWFVGAGAPGFVSFEVTFHGQVFSSRWIVSSGGRQGEAL